MLTILNNVENVQARMKALGQQLKSVSFLHYMNRVFKVREKDSESKNNQNRLHEEFDKKNLWQSCMLLNILLLKYSSDFSCLSTRSTHEHTNVGVSHATAVS